MNCTFCMQDFICTFNNTMPAGKNQRAPRPKSSEQNDKTDKRKSNPKVQKSNFRKAHRDLNVVGMFYHLCIPCFAMYKLCQSILSKNNWTKVNPMAKSSIPRFSLKRVKVVLLVAKVHQAISACKEINLYVVLSKTFSAIIEGITCRVWRRRGLF